MNSAYTLCFLHYLPLKQTCSNCVFIAILPTDVYKSVLSPGNTSSSDRWLSMGGGGDWTDNPCLITRRTVPRCRVGRLDPLRVDTARLEPAQSGVVRDSGLPHTQRRLWKASGSERTMKLYRVSPQMDALGLHRLLIWHRPHGLSCQSFKPAPETLTHKCVVGSSSKPLLLLSAFYRKIYRAHRCGVSAGWCLR